MKIVNSFNLAAVLIVFLAMIPFLVNLKDVTWSIIDDTSSYQTYQDLNKAITNLNPAGVWSILSEKGSRFRPFYFIYIYTTYLLLGFNATVHHLVRILIYAILSFTLIKYFYSFSKNFWLPLLYGYLFSISPLVIENIFRLGPVELIAIIIFVFLLFYFKEYIEGRFSKKNAVIVWVILSALFFTKEVFVVIVVAIFGALLLYNLILSFFNKKINFKINLKEISKIFLILSSVGLFYLGIYLLNKNLASSIENGQEVSNYLFSVSAIKLNFKSMMQNIFIWAKFETVVLAVVLMICLVELFSARLRAGFLKTKLFPYMLTSFFTMLALFLIQVPWRYVLARYFIVIEFFLIVSSFFFIAYLLENIKLYVNERVFKLINILLFTTLILFALPEIVSSNIYDLNYNSWYAGFTQFENKYTSDLDKIHSSYRFPVVYNYKNNIGNVEVYQMTNTYLEMTGKKNVGKINYLEDVCFSDIDLGMMIVVDRVGDKYTNLSKYQDLIKGEVYIPQINAQAFDYKWSIYKLSKKEACI